MEKKIVRYERHYEDGTSDFVEGEFLENFQTNLGIANGIVGSRSYIQFKPVEWTPKVAWIVKLGGTLTDGTNVTVEDAIKNLGNEITNRQQAFIKAHNTLLDEDDEEQEQISEFDLEDDTYEDMIDLCELYHQIRNGKR